MSLKAEAELAQLREQLRVALRRASVRERRFDELREAVYQAAKQAHLAHGPAPILKPPPSPKRGGKEEMALIHLTDWQLGKKSKTFDVATCHKRIGQAMQTAVQLTDIQRAHHPVRECHIMLGGDMIEGLTVFPGQAYEVEAHLFEQQVSAAALIETSVQYALANFQTVHVWEEIGNHGRIGRKGELPHGDNHDRMAYHLARARLVDVYPEKRLVWHPWAGGLGTPVDVGNYKALLMHGDEIKSFGGNVPAYGILKKITAFASGVLDPFQDAYMGHFHTPMMLTMPNANRIWVTGSPESDNEFAKEFMAAVGRPSQRLNFVEPDKGRVTSEHVLWLT